MPQCEKMIWVESEDCERQCRHPGSHDVGRKWYCTVHDPSADAGRMNYNYDRRKKDEKLYGDLRKHSVSDREILNGIVDRALAMLRKSVVE